MGPSGAVATTCSPGRGLAPSHAATLFRRPTRLLCARSTVASSCRPTVTRTCTTGCTLSTPSWPEPYGRGPMGTWGGGTPSAAEDSGGMGLLGQWDERTCSAPLVPISVPLLLPKAVNPQASKTCMLQGRPHGGEHQRPWGRQPCHHSRDSPRSTSCPRVSANRHHGLGLCSGQGPRPLACEVCWGHPSCPPCCWLPP